jgi:hypothetical protein
MNKRTHLSNLPKQCTSSAVPRPLPATKHTAWLGAHAPGANQPRASGTTGAAAPSSHGPRRRRQGGGLACRAVAAAGTTAFPTSSLRTQDLSHVASPPAFVCGYPSPLLVSCCERSRPPRRILPHPPQVHHPHTKAGGEATCERPCVRKLKVGKAVAPAAVASSSGSDFFNAED